MEFMLYEFGESVKGKYSQAVAVIIVAPRMSVAGCAIIPFINVKCGINYSLKYRINKSLYRLKQQLND